MAKPKTQYRKPQPRKLKAKWELPTTFSISLDYMVLHPPPTSLDKCPRCEKKHKKLKPLKLKKPMEFYSPDGKHVAKASHWAQCPKTKEPIVLFDRVDAGHSIEQLVMKQSADDIAKEIDKEILSDLAKYPKLDEALEKRGKWVKKKGKRGQEVWRPDPALNPNPSKVEVKATMSDMKAWVYDPNAPERIVPGTKAAAKAQRARVKAQEKAVKGKKR